MENYAHGSNWTINNHCEADTAWRQKKEIELKTTAMPMVDPAAGQFEILEVILEAKQKKSDQNLQP